MDSEPQWCVVSKSKKSSRLKEKGDASTESYKHSSQQKQQRQRGRDREQQHTFSYKHDKRKGKGELVPESAVNAQSLYQSIQRTAATLRTCEFYKATRDAIDTSLKSETTTQQISKLVVLGIGQFSESPAALLQISFAVCLASDLHLLECVDGCQSTSNDDSSSQSTMAESNINNDGNKKADGACTLFDPLLTEIEKIVCARLGIAVSNENNRGKEAFLDKTLVFMPHCPYGLYCNLLWANWFHLNSIVIIGNSFKSYGIRRLDHTDFPSESLGPQGLECDAEGSWSTTPLSSRQSRGKKKKTKSELKKIMNGADQEVNVFSVTDDICNDGQDPQLFNVDAITKKISSTNTDCVAYLDPLITEIPLSSHIHRGNQGRMNLHKDLLHLENAFNDISVHFFPTSSLYSIGGRNLLHESNRPSEHDIDLKTKEDIEIW